jgi:hypothetical protein
MKNDIQSSFCQFFVLTGLVAACVSGCGTGSNGDKPMASSSSVSAASGGLDDVGATLLAFRIEPPKRSVDDISDRARRLANVVFGADIPTNAFQVLASEINSRGTGEAIHVDIATREGLRVGYNAAGDQSWAWNETLMNDTSSPGDVGVMAATSAFERAFNGMMGAGLLDATGLDFTRPKISHIMQGAGRPGEPRVERIKEYVFFVPRLINGIPLANGTAAFPAGVQVAVHRDGGLASIKVTGPFVHSGRATPGVEVPQAPGYSLTRQVSRADLDARIGQEYPGSTITHLGLQYRLQDDRVDTVVIPMQGYGVSSNTVVNGRTVHGRIQYVYYSVEAENAGPTLWPIPNPNAKSDRPR